MIIVMEFVCSSRTLSVIVSWQSVNVDMEKVMTHYCVDVPNNKQTSFMEWYYRIRQTILREEELLYYHCCEIILSFNFLAQ
jgi:hypothetical protein